MATQGDRGSSWTNSDGLVIGFGTNQPAQGGAANKYGAAQGMFKTAQVTFDFKDMNEATVGTVVTVPVPAGSRVVDVRVVCHTLWTSTGTNTFEVGLTGGDVDGYVTTTTGTIANMTAGAVLTADGVFTYDDTADGDATAAELKLFASADTIDLLTAMSDWTAGSASLIVSYI
jgi:hypothetical protein